MENKLAELAEKIYTESVEKAKQESTGILNDARKESDRILREAQQEKEAIIHAAEQEAASVKARARAEIHMLTDNALAALREEITNLIRYQVVEKPVKSVLGKEELLAPILAEALRHLQTEADGQVMVDLPDSLGKEVQDYLKTAVGELLSKEPEIGNSGSHFNGFSIRMRDKGFSINFTDESFKALLDSYFNQEMNDLLGNDSNVAK